MTTTDGASSAVPLSSPTSAVPASSTPETSPTTNATPTSAPTQASASATPDSSVADWSQPILISSDPRLSSSALAIDDEGNLHVVGTSFRWLRREYGEWTNQVFYLTNASGHWTSRQISDEAAYRARTIAVDNGGGVAVAYAGTAGNDCTGCEEGPVYVAVKRNGGWAAPEVVGDGAFSDPSLAMADGVVHVVYQFVGYECWIGDEGEEHPGPDCGAQYATDAAGEWAIQQIDPHVYAFPSVALSSSGLARIAFMGDESLGLATQDATGSFTVERLPVTLPIRARHTSLSPGQSDLRDLQLVLNSADEPTIVTNERLDDDSGTATWNRYLLVRKADGDWSADELEVDLPSLRIAIDAQGEVHWLAWDGDELGAPGLWYSSEAATTPTKLAVGRVSGVDLHFDSDGRLFVIYTNGDGVWLRNTLP